MRRKGREAPQAQAPVASESPFSVRTAADLINYGADLDAAVEIAPNVYQARGTGNTHMVTTPEGNVIIDTGTSAQSARHRELLSAVSSGPIRYVVVSHAHNDHAGGAATWTDEGTEVVAHARFPEAQRYLNELMPFQTNRNLVLFFGRNPVRQANVAERAAQARTRVEPTILVNDLFEFELGGTRFEVISTPGAEGDDSVSVWLPESRILFAGDFLGPSFRCGPTSTRCVARKCVLPPNTSSRLTASSRSSRRFSCRATSSRSKGPRRFGRDCSAYAMPSLTCTMRSSTA